MSEHIIEIKLFTRLLNEKLKDNEVLNIVNCLKDRLSFKLKLDLNLIEHLNVCNLVEDDNAPDDINFNLSDIEKLIV